MYNISTSTEVSNESRESIELLLNAINDQIAQFRLSHEDSEQEDGEVEVSESGEGDRYLSKPSTEQLKIMNLSRPKGSREYTADDISVFTVVASHNLMSRSRGAWDIDSLKVMADQYGSLRRPFQVNHEWFDVGANQAFCFEARLMKASTAPDEILNAVDFSEVNKSIVKEDGFIWVEVDVAIARNHMIEQAIFYQSIKDCSTGGLRKPLTGCPICTRSRGEFVDGFDDEECPHIMPVPYIEWYVDLDNPEVRKLLAPYYIRAGLHSIVELSAVVMGDLPGAKIA
jgi:hypothetical protein